ncbi:hypothetical protein [Cerasicoccus arenae]|uniref:Uncharacterized protein n=1 Tax=Cerasicoccus arenae TaxID=424488 RepID=A0A8J3DKF4_9BACT|nr:hypothetical protein [Cerasicoccus arenae]MBK1858399.1 hypothetical protein [Cerasicoccus arenae]GHC10025.1 hypothetical protein GCM10007047_29280 [Cerasicoccus arenae]
MDSIPLEQSRVSWSASDIEDDIDSNGITARWTSEANFRSILQSITWQGGYVTGFGFQLAPNQNGGPGLNYTRNQSYAIDIQELSSAGSGSQTILSTIHTELFTMPASIVQANNVIYLEFDGPVYLDAGTYGFNLRPTDIKGGNVLVLAKSTNGEDTIALGGGAQNAIPGVLDVNYPIASIDIDFLCFVTNASPALQLRTLGITLAENQNGGAGLMFNQSQDYALDIYELDDATSETPVIESLLHSQEYTIKLEDVSPNRVLEFQLNTPLDLEYGGSYGFNLRPVEIIGGNVLVVARSETGARSLTYADGRGAQPTTEISMSSSFPVSSADFNLLFYASDQAPLIKRIQYGPTNTYFTYTHTNGFWPDSHHAVIIEGAFPQYGKAIHWDMDNGTSQLLYNFNAPLKMYYSVSSNGKLITTIRNKLHVIDLNGIEEPWIAYDAGSTSGIWSLTDCPDITTDGRFAVTNINAVSLDQHTVTIFDLENSGAIDLTLTFDEVMNHVHFSPYDENWVMFGHSGGHPSEYRDRIWAHNPVDAPNCAQLWNQLGPDGTSYDIGHERAVFHKEATIFVAYRGSTAGGGLGEVSFQGDFNMLSSSDRYWHCNINQTGTYALVDSIVTPGEPPCDVLLIDLSTGQASFLYRGSRDQHPYHPHPHFSPDGNWVIFNDFDTQSPIAIELL